MCQNGGSSNLLTSGQLQQKTIVGLHNEKHNMNTQQPKMLVDGFDRSRITQGDARLCRMIPLATVVRPGDGSCSRPRAAYPCRRRPFSDIKTRATRV